MMKLTGEVWARLIDLVRVSDMLGAAKALDFSPAAYQDVRHGLYH